MKNLDCEVELYSVVKFARLCSMSVPTVYKLSKQGKLEILKFGYCSRIRRTELERFIRTAPTLH